MRQYLEILDRILYKGTESEDRTGTGTFKTFGERMCFNLQDGFPLLTTKHIPFKLVSSELLWFIQGGRSRNLNIKDLYKIHTNKIWDEWATDAGDLGPVYGVQWRSWPAPSGDSEWNIRSREWDHHNIDQLQNVIDQIRTNPESRRHIVSAWNVAELPKMRLAPCHILFQFYVADGKLSCQMYQRSCDMFLGVPFNIASYSLLTHMVAEVCGLKPDKFIWIGGDCHIYNNHTDQVLTQLGREPRTLPELTLHHRDNIDDFTMQDFEIDNYKPHAHIPAPISV